MSSRLYREGREAEALPLAFRPADGVPSPRPSTVMERRQSGGTEAEIQARVAAAEQRAYAAGETAGLAAGTKRAAEQMAPVLANFAKLIEELSKARANVRRDAESGTVDLALAVARRILNRELSIDPEAIFGLVKSAAERLNVREMHSLRVSPSDFNAIESQRSRLNLPVAVKILSDPSLVPGSAVFDTARGEVDASVQTQLEEIQRGLTDIVRRERHAH